ncbi:MAG: hypothetical protein GW762_03735 [Candidatus Pacebacteria bacterium]|nr:hypothetical protein [Candidatus Paceibacterota bacterium]PIR63270.1 MAG: hypothetical protein COU64_05265 [Candidatus Pacebacteria bacterium CG10_big_fil_rev_8_21_14_0_10_40_26]PIZ79151.1 MAG: hypothetical protein COY01_01855 [Candidatus Pacebacteria bacterium CG_4_10_14_0_2_um_filter_40_20]PJA68806.1 MAG: hypothetical protein CO156_02460 [Candidatus Pacebacteria bacterium CG_4_9_14_3_um_filter_40_12]PJC42117.1 MAG: hypothetical protein CO041_00565 [Candidatus Pacebacteria bacterium CG_4_9_
MPGGPKPSGTQMRPSGGFNASPGGMSEHMDEAAMQQAASQKATSQQASQISPQQMAQAAAQKQATQQPREMGTIGDEVKRMGGDLLKEMKALFSFATLFGIEPSTLSPEEKEKLKIIHQNYQKLDQEQQAYARQKYQEEQQRKKMLEQEAAQRKQQEEAAQSQVIMPSSPQKGAKQGGSQKQQTTQRLQDKRKTLGGPGDIN